jgi:hypothetical protein
VLPVKNYIRIQSSYRTQRRVKLARMSKEKERHSSPLVFSEGATLLTVFRD